MESQLVNSTSPNYSTLPFDRNLFDRHFPIIVATGHKDLPLNQIPLRDPKPIATTTESSAPPFDLDSPDERVPTSFTSARGVSDEYSRVTMKQRTDVVNVLAGGHASLDPRAIAAELCAPPVRSGYTRVEPSTGRILEAIIDAVATQ